MYLFNDMIDMGLPNGVSWPSKKHRLAAQSILIGNPSVTNMDQLSQGVINIINIPEKTLQTLTVNDLSKYGFNVSTSISVKV